MVVKKNWQKPKDMLEVATNDALGLLTHEVVASAKFQLFEHKTKSVAFKLTTSELTRQNWKHLQATAVILQMKQKNI